MTISKYSGHTQGTSIVTPEEGKELFNLRVRQTLGISGEDFFERWDRGEYRNLPDTPDGRRISLLVMLMPFGRDES